MGGWIASVVYIVEVMSSMQDSAHVSGVARSVELGPSLMMRTAVRAAADYPISDASCLKWA